MLTYDPVLLAQLRGKTAASIDDLGGLRCHDSEAADAMATVRATADMLDTRWLPTIDRIVGSNVLTTAMPQFLDGSDIGDEAWLGDLFGSITSLTGDVSFDDVIDWLKGALGSSVSAEVVNEYGDDRFLLVKAAIAMGKIAKAASGRPLIFQSGALFNWMLGQAGGTSRLLGQGSRFSSAIGFLNTPGMRLVTRRVGIAGGLYSTATGAWDLYQQGNPIDAFEREGAGYVADVASTAFSASSTAFLIAPNPVTGALVVGTGAVWLGAEVVDHWDDITEFASDAWDAGTGLAADAWDAGTRYADQAVDAASDLASDAWDAGSDFVSDVGGGVTNILGGIF